MKSSRTPNELLPTRQSLRERLKDWSDQESWQQFFDTYWELIYGVAVKSGLTDTEAQDVVQDTMAAVAKNIRKFHYDERGSFKAWLLQGTRWRITDQFRKRMPVAGPQPAAPGEEPRTALIERLPSPTGYDLDTAWEDEWRQHLQDVALHRLKQKLSAKHYQVFDLYVVKNWPPEKVAAALRVSVALVYQVKSRATPLLRDEVERLEKELV